MTTVILTNFNLEFYFGTQLFVISGVNYLRSHKKKIKWSGIGLLTSELWWRIHLGTARLCDITIENMSYLRKHSSIMRTTHATNRRGIVPPSQHGRFFKPTIRKATISGFHGLISEWSGDGGRHCCGIMLPSLPYLPFLYFFLLAGVNYMLVGLPLRDTWYDSLRFDFQPKATGYNSFRFIQL